MNQDQITSLVRALLAIVGTFATTAGWLTTDQVNSLTVDMLSVIGPVFVLGSLVWSFFKHSNAQQIQTALNNPAIQSIVVKDNNAVPSKLLGHPKLRLVQ